jgi:phosphate:Na+ symporter
MVQTGVMRAYGGDLRRFLRQHLRNRCQALLAGLGITVVLQSSTATCLLAASFAGRGLIAAVPALAILLGADVGSALVAQVLSFDLSVFSSLLLTGGVLAFLTSKVSRRRNLARAAIGLGMMLLALRIVVTTAQPTGDVTTIVAILTALAKEPFLALLAAALLTWLAHSSLAVILLVTSLASTGLIPLPLAFALVLGANLGNPLPALAGTIGAPQPARRVALANLVFKATGVLLLIPFLHQLGFLLSSLELDPGRQVVNLHLIFNVGLALLFIPLIGPIASLTARIFPGPRESTDLATTVALDPTVAESPAVALSRAAREAMRMGDTVESMLSLSFEALSQGDREIVARVRRMEDTLDGLHREIMLYLTKVCPDEMDEAEHRRYREVTGFSTNLEHIGDIIDRGIMDAAARKGKKRIQFSQDGLDEIATMQSEILDNLRIALGLFTNPAAKTARNLVEAKVKLRALEQTSIENHLTRLGRGDIESIETSSLYLNVLRDLKRINSHVTSLAYFVLEASGELQSTRLKPQAVWSSSSDARAPAVH